MPTKRLFAVIHVSSLEQAVRNAGVAARAGCDGIFLISHNVLDYEELALCIRPCREIIPYVGANFLDLFAEDAAVFASFNGIPAVWTDRTYGGLKPQGLEIFSGFAFKYMPQPRDLVAEAKLAAECCHVLTTSGPGTGKPADVEKVKAIRAAVEGVRLALASGVSVDNVEDYFPYVDDFLVATGISSTWSELDPERTKELADVIHASV